jgi:gluconokinase
VNEKDRIGTAPVPPGPLLVVCGVSGVGKTEVGRRVADRLGVPFADADDLHTPAAIAQMARGEPLTDADRAPWLDRLATRLQTWSDAQTGGVLACSALRAAYRSRLARAAPGVRFVLLTASESTLRARLRDREGHFFPPTLLESQLATLEAAPALPTVATDGQTPDEAAEAVVAQIRVPEAEVRDGGGPASSRTSDP